MRKFKYHPPLSAYAKACRRNERQALQAQALAAQREETTPYSKEESLRQFHELNAKLGLTASKVCAP